MMEEFTEEFTDASEQQVAAMLRSLKVVEAPTDFNTRVRAGIAQGRPETRSSWMPVFVRGAIPAMLILAIVGYFAYTTRTPQVLPEPVAKTVEAQQPVTNAQALVGQPAVKPPAETPQAPLVAQAEPKRVMPKTEPNNVQKRVEPVVKSAPDAGSVVLSGSAPPVLTALDPSLMQKLVTAGVKLKKGAVESAPASTGLKAGDVIQSTSGSTVTVKRGGKSVQVVVKD